MSDPVLVRLNSRALVRVSGPDARPFLHNLLTQDVESLAEGELRYGALLTPQGRLAHALFLRGEADGVLLDVAAVEREAVVGKLKLYKLRAKITVDAVEGGVTASWAPEGMADPPGEGQADPRLPQLGRRTYGETGAETDAETAGEDAYDAHRLALGVTDPERDCPDPTYPIEANFDLLNGVDFKKGCFVGQETTSRMKRRGIIKTRLCPVAFEGPPPPPGAEILAGVLRAGEMRSGRVGRALALVRLDRAAGASLTVEGRPLRLDPPAWLAPAVTVETALETLS